MVMVLGLPGAIFAVSVYNSLIRKGADEAPFW